MGCLYEDRMEGYCTLCMDDDGEPDFEQLQQGCDEGGVCVVSDDPDPSENCDKYESDYTCNECGQDLNVNDCTCDDEEE